MLRSEWIEPQTGLPSPGVLCRGDKPPWQPGEPLGQRERLEKPRFHLWGVLACPQLGQREICPNCCLLTMLPSLSLVNAPAPPTAGHSLAQQGKRHNRGLHLSGTTDICTDRASDLCKHTSPTCFSTPLLWGESPSVGRRKNTHLKGTQSAWTRPSGLLLQQMGNKSHSWQGSDGHWADRKSCLTPWAGSS